MDGSKLRFTTIDELLEHYSRISPEMRCQERLFLKKPLKRPTKLIEKVDLRADGRQESKSIATRSLQLKTEALQKLVSEKETFRTEIKQQYLDEQIEKIQQLIPQGQSVQEVWHKEKNAIKRSFEKRISFRPEASEVDEDKMKEDAGTQFDTEKRIMQNYVSINGRSITLKVGVQENLYLLVRLNALYKELKTDVNNVLDGYEGNMKELEKSSKHTTAQYINGKQDMRWQHEMKDRVTNLRVIMDDMSKLGSRIQTLIRNIKNESRELKEEAEKQWNEQWKLRYMPGELKSMHDIVLVITQEAEQKMQEVEELFEQTTVIEDDVRKAMELIEGRKQKFEVIWQRAAAHWEARYAMKPSSGKGWYQLHDELIHTYSKHKERRIVLAKSHAVVLCFKLYRFGTEALYFF